MTDHLRGALLAAPIVLACGTIVGCVAANVATDTSKAAANVANVCASAVPLASVYPPVGVYVTAACATANSIAQIAASPTGVQWISQLNGELQAIKNPPTTSVTRAAS